MAELASSSSNAERTTTTEVLPPPITHSSPSVVRIQLQKVKTQKKVDWDAKTIDNENMGKKKSKCCCIYKKPSVFGESSSESEDECEHCVGHPEKRKKKNQIDKSNEQQLEPPASND